MSSILDIHRPGSLFRGISLVGFAALCALVAPSLASAQTAIDFEDLPTGTIVTGQYRSEGVIFARAYLAEEPAARSGSRALRTVGPTTEVFLPIPLVIVFTQPQARVKLYALSSHEERQGTLKAFDRAGRLLAADGPKPVAADAFSTMFETRAASARIARVELTLEGGSQFAIDNLEFDRTTVETQRPLVQVIETRQPAAADDPAVHGVFPETWVVMPPRETAAPTQQEATESGPEERIAFQFAPSVQRELAPGASAELNASVGKKFGLAGSVRWIGTGAPLAVALSVNGADLSTGQSYALGQNRGGADLGGVAEATGEAKLLVTNTTDVAVKVMLNLGIVPP